MSLCVTCEKAIFVADIGEYKCGINGVTYDNLLFCGDYERGTPKESKANEEYYECDD